MAISFTVAVGIGPIGCAPRTDLTAEEHSGTDPTDGGAAGPATASLVDPMAGATDVPLNLATVWVRFPIAVSVPDGALVLSTSAVAARTDRFAGGACPDGSQAACLMLPIVEPLQPSASYVLTMGDGVIDEAGRAVPAGVVGTFSTAASLDLVPPGILEVSVQPAGPCAQIDFATDEPAQAAVRIEGGAEVRRIPAGAGRSVFSLAVPLLGLPAGQAVSIVIEAQDLAGNRAESPAVALVVPDDLVPIAITEVHANPAGPEPAQEFVEVRNLGSVPLDLAGLAIADAKGMDVLPAAVIAGGAYALIVPSGFDAASAKDTAPRAGTLLVRVDSRLGSDGLSNGGESVRLLSAAGHAVSSYAAPWAPLDVSAATWSGRSVHRVPDDACDQEASWTRRPEAATPGWAAP